jgi:hypothetical protein
MKPARVVWPEKLVRIASIVFGGYIALTSAALIFIGVQGWGGWLSITYGLLGIATGLAGVAATFVDRPFRSALFGWLFVGVAFRSIIDGSIYLVFFTAPFALLLLAALVVELTSNGNLANVAAALIAGAAAIVAMFLLRAVAPYFPPICPPTHAGVLFSYPGNVGFWDEAQSKFDDVCLSRGFTQ